MRFKTLKRAFGLGALGALGAGAVAAAAIASGNRRVTRWETLSPDDAGDGDFVGLSDGARMRYLVRGTQGSPVILVHGLMDSAQHWAKNLDALAREHRVWAVDLVGFGFSSRVTEPKYSLQYFARTLREFMDAQGIARASIVGHSLGGAVTLEFAHAYPMCVEKLVLIAPGTYLTNLVGWLGWLARVPYVPRALIGFALTSHRARMRAWRRAVGDASHIDWAELPTRIRVGRVKGTADALVAMLGSSWTNHLGERLGEVAAPTLILWGDRDRSVPLAHAARHARALPNARLVVLEGAGHIPHNEYPARVNQLILDFLRAAHEA